MISLEQRHTEARVDQVVSAADSDNTSTNDRDIALFRRIRIQIQYFDSLCSLLASAEGVRHIGCKSKLGVIQYLDTCFRYDNVVLQS